MIQSQYYKKPELFFSDLAIRRKHDGKKFCLLKEEVFEVPAFFKANLLVYVLTLHLLRLNKSFSWYKKEEVFEKNAPESVSSSWVDWIGLRS